MTLEAQRPLAVSRPRRLRRLVRRVARFGPAGTAGLALAGALPGFAILYFDYPFPKDSHRFTESGPYYLWLLLLCGQVAFWAALLPALARAVREFSRRATPNPRMVAGMTSAFALLVVLPVVIGKLLRSPPKYPLPQHELKVDLITGLGVAVALVGVAAVALVYTAISEALARKGPSSPAEIKRYFHLRSALVQLLAIEGAILSAAILSTSALRHAVVSTSGVPSRFPKETLLAYGTYLSAIVALLYWPAYAHLLDLGRKLRDRTVRLDDPSQPLVAKLEARQKLGELLDLELSTSTSFRSAALILTPLTSSLIGLLFGAK